MPDAGGHLFEWFRDASSMRRWDSGYPAIISPGDWKAWEQMIGIEIRSSEWDMLRKMDETYVGAMIEEIKANAERLRESGK